MSWLTKSRESRILRDLPPVVLQGPAADSELFRQVPAVELARLDQLGTVVDVPAGAEVVSEGGLGSQCVVVLDGQMRVERDGEVIADVKPGYFGGEMSMLYQERCNATVTAATDSVVYAMSRGEFQTLMATCPRIEDQVRATAKTRIG